MKERVLRACLAAEIQVRPLWLPAHLQRPYKDMHSFEVSRAVWFYDRLLNLPCSVNITDDQVDEVVAILGETADFNRAKRQRGAR